MTTKSRIRRALTALETRRLELERLISDDLERKFLTVPEGVLESPATTASQSGGLTISAGSPTWTAGFSTMTWTNVDSPTSSD